MAVKDHLVFGVAGDDFIKQPLLRVGKGQTSSEANAELIKKPVCLYKNMEVVVQKEGEGVYLEGGVYTTSGWNFPVAEAAFESGVTTLLRAVALSKTLVVQVFKDGSDSKGKVRAGTIGTGNVITWGTVKEVNAVDTDSISIKRIDAATFVIGYMDDGGSDYLAARIGTVSGTAITLGTEKEVVAAAVNDAGIGVAVPRSGIVFFAYALNADNKGYGVAIDYTTTTFGTAGSAVAFTTVAPASAIDAVSHDNGDVSVIYQDGGVASDPITLSCGTVAANKTVAFGTKVSMAGAASAATSCRIVKLEKDLVAYSWIDATKPHINSATISGTVPTKKTELELESTAALSPALDAISSDQVVVVLEDDNHASDIGKIYYLTYSAGVFTKVKTNRFTNAAIAQPCVAALNDPDRRIYVGFQDDAASDVGNAMVSKWEKNLFDVRASGVSAYYRLWVMPCMGRRRTA